MVYLWRIPDGTPDALIARYRRADSPDRLAFTEGVLLATERREVHFEFKSGARDLASLDCLPNDARLPVVGLRVLEVLESMARDDFQLIPTTVHTLDGMRSNQFSLLNITHSVMAIDHGASIFKMIPGTSSILRFQKLVYRPDSLGAHVLARDAEYRSHVLVAEQLVEQLRAIGATGVDLKRAESIAW